MEAFYHFITSWEWVLLLAVGILEALILKKVYQEKRERETLIREMKSTRIELGRESYLAMIKDTLVNAQHKVFFVSHSLTASMMEGERDAIFKLYRKGVDHRCITGRDPGKIKEMWEQHRRGVAVRVNDLVLQSTFRYQVCDGKVAVLGFAEGGDEASRKGILIDNIYFSRVLQDHFLRTWEESQTFLDYLGEILCRPRTPEIAFSLPELAEEWSLSTEEAKVVENLMSPVRAGTIGRETE